MLEISIRVFDIFSVADFNKFVSLVINRQSTDLGAKRHEYLKNIYNFLRDQRGTIDLLNITLYCLKKMCLK